MGKKCVIDLEKINLSDMIGQEERRVLEEEVDLIINKDIEININDDSNIIINGASKEFNELGLNNKFVRIINDNVIIFSIAIGLIKILQDRYYLKYNKNLF